MTAQAFEQHTYLPEQTQQMADVLSFLKAHEDRVGSQPEPRYLLVGAGEHEQVQMPASAHRILLQVLEAMKAGKAVTVAPQNQLLTTQQVADLLGISRPTVVKLIDRGELPAEKPGTRRRMVKLRDALAYRKQRRDAQYRALAETSEDYADELTDDAGAAEARFRRVRAEAAARRRGGHKVDG